MRKKIGLLDHCKVESCGKSWDQNCIELAKTWVWEHNHKAPQVFLRLKSTSSKSGGHAIIKNRFLAWHTRTGWPRLKLALHRLIRDLGGWQPHGQILFQILKFSWSFWDGQRRSKKFHPPSNWSSDTQWTLNRNFSQRRIKPTILSLFERLYT